MYDITVIFAKHFFSCSRIVSITTEAEIKSNRNVSNKLFII